jgi:polyferredoxin
MPLRPPRITPLRKAPDTPATGSAAAPRQRSKIRFTRREPDHAQAVRRTVQVAFLLLNVWIGVQFYLFVRYVETGGQVARVARPPGVEGWLPIAALMNLKYWLLTWEVPDVHPAGLFLLVAFVGISLLLRKAFCSWLCPIGTLSEWLWQGGQALCGRTWLPPRWLDIALRGLKYLLLAFFGYAVASMSPEAIAAFLTSPYGLVADVKMLNFFRHLGTTAAAVIAALFLVSVVVKNAWCRYLCPYGGLLGLVALVSPVSIRRTPDACIDCAKCAKACPSALPVDRLGTVRSAECTACLLCVSACPAAGALDLTAGQRPLSAWAVATGLALIFLGSVGYARAAGHWHGSIPDAVYFQLVPHADAYGHPQ